MNIGLDALSLEDESTPRVQSFFQCSFCYEHLSVCASMCSSGGPLMCGTCGKHPYCSETCQKSDWKQHKIWCGKACELNVDYEIRASPGEGRGYGVFALRPMAKGDKVLVERPVLQKKASEGYETINEQFEACTPSIQAAIQALHKAASVSVDSSLDPVFLGRGMQSFNQNSFGLEPGSGLFITASRFNHSCLPNCGRAFLDDQGLMVISAAKAIEVGDELEICYTCFHLADGFESYQEYLMSAWGFRCSCRACSDLSVFEMLKQLELMDTRLLGLAMSGREKEAFRIGEQMIAIYDELDILHTRYNRTYCDMFQIALMQRQTMGKAMECAEKALYYRELSIGGSNEPSLVLQKSRNNLLNPSSHRSYLALEGTPFEFSL